MASLREQRMAENESLFRLANERMAGWEEQHASGATEPYFCECADTDCRQKVRLRKADYERVRSNPRHFVVAPDHQIPEVERVIEANDGWLVVEKTSEVAGVVEALDPRGD